MPQNMNGFADIAQAKPNKSIR